MNEREQSMKHVVRNALVLALGVLWVGSTAFAATSTSSPTAAALHMVATRNIRTSVWHTFGGTGLIARVSAETQAPPADATAHGMSHERNNAA